MTCIYLLKNELRGGVSYIAKRYAKANDKYTEDHDPKKASTFITYLDMNNLYGWVMSGYLLYGGLEWLKNVDEFDVMPVSEKRKIGYLKLTLNILMNYMIYTMIIL